MISAGREHALAIDRDNRLWVWGSNARGQLGMEAMMLAQLDGANRKGSAMFKPFRIASGGIHGLKFKHASAGWEFTVVVSQVWTYECSKCSDGERPSSEPQLSLYLSHVSSLASICLQQGGEVYTWGANEKGQVFFPLSLSLCQLADFKSRVP